MRIVLATTSYPRNAEDSAGIFVARLARALAGRGHALTVVAPGDARAPAEETVGGVRVRRVPYAWPAGRMRLAYGAGGIPARIRREPWALVQAPALALAMARAVVREARGADVIHAQWSFAGALGRIASRATGAPLVLTTRGSYEMAAGGPFGRARDWAIAGARAVVTVNEKFADALRARGVPAARLHVVSNGVALRPGRRARRAAARARLDVPEGERMLVNVGNLAEAKGVDLFAASAALLGPRKDYRLYVVGGGAEGRRAELRQAAAALGAGERIVWVGSVAPAAVDDWLDAADLFVFPSLGEGRPNAVLEAMAAELPVLASDLPEVREIVDDGRTGRLFPPGDARAMAAAIGAFLDAPGAWDALGTRAQAFLAERGLTWEACAARYEKIYEEACRG